MQNLKRKRKRNKKPLLSFFPMIADTTKTTLVTRLLEQHLPGQFPENIKTLTSDQKIAIIWAYYFARDNTPLFGIREYLFKELGIPYGITDERVTEVLHYPAAVVYRYERLQLRK